MFEELETTAAYVGNGYQEEAQAPKEQDDVINLILRVDETNIEDRLEGLTGRHFRMLNKDPEAQMAFLACFMVNEDGRYLTQDEAFEVLDQLSMAQILEALQYLMQELPNAAAPKKSRKQSTKAHISKYR